MIQCWCYRGLLEQGDLSDKIFSQREYELLLSLLSDVMLKNPESSVQARSLIMKIWECDRLGEYRKAAIIDTSTNRVPIKLLLGSLIVNWKREDVCKPNEEKRMEEGEIRDMILFAKKNTSPEGFKFFKEGVIKSLRLCGREGMKEDIDYGDYAKELFSELERTIFGPRGDGPWNNLRSQSKVPLPLDGSGDGPKSEFEAPSVSGISGSHKKRSVFTLSGSE